jgi:hypothetical protein
MFDMQGDRDGDARIGGMLENGRLSSKAIALRAIPLIRHASHDTFPRKGGRGAAP